MALVFRRRNSAVQAVLKHRNFTPRAFLRRAFFDQAAA
jgi:hypothetical protein